ncbi:response regulator [Tahibacter soli]|uniref:Response regulator transcription factor n=1 Tax=Tahibacter soli TaxID=2983605 RepID=A0A9X3YR70_9GAMM|nr:response regulator transcription factor [Tahibacter soli]MDC8015603.1 response regulator transcription factor [Tahibacter soli]
MNDAALPCVLVVDDEPQIRKFLDISLRAQGYATLLAATGHEALERAATRSIDLVVLDLGLPDIEGHDVLRQLREWSAVPVLVLSVRASESEKVRALDAGANDYVTKPFGVEELAARIRVLLRGRPGETAAPVYDDGRLRIDLARREVTLDGAAVHLTRKEYAIVALLVRHAGRVVTQQQLLRELWGPTHVEDTHYLRIAVGKLRQKLGDDAAAPRWLETEPGVGYRWRGV